MTSTRVLERLRGEGTPLPRPAAPLRPAATAKPPEWPERVPDPEAKHGKRPRLLVVYHGNEPTEAVARMIERRGFRPVFLAAAGLRLAVAPPPADAVLLLREVPTGTKRSLALWFREAQGFSHTPIAAITTLIEGLVPLPVDFVARPSVPLGEAVDHLAQQL